MISFSPTPAGRFSCPRIAPRSSSPAPVGPKRFPFLTPRQHSDSLSTMETPFQAAPNGRVPMPPDGQFLVS